MTDNPGKISVLYDDECSLCTFQMRLITWMDWLDRIALVPLSHPRRKILAPGIPEERLQEAIHCFTPEGQIHRGARCIRHISLRMPLGIPLALILWFPGIIWIAERIYAWVSRNRQLLSRLFGCKGACKILPQRKRESDLHG